jgi:hypothetical protein
MSNHRLNICSFEGQVNLISGLMIHGDAKRKAHLDFGVGLLWLIAALIIRLTKGRLNYPEWW